MRDLLILVTLAACLLGALKNPFIGVMSWTVVSLASPHMQFGYAAADWPVAVGFALVTLVGLAVTRDRQNPMLGAPPRLLLAFVIWTCVTLPFSMHFEPSYRLWERSMKIFLMFFVSIALTTNRKRLDLFIWANVAAVGYYGVKGGVFTVLTGGNHRVWGPGGFIEGNNEVALAVLCVVPLMRYLQLQMIHKWAVAAATAAMGLCVATALGTHSRGALLGLGAMAFLFWLKGGNKLLWGALIAVLGVGLLSMMPDAWWQRMNTIQAYEADASALGRLNAWHMAFNLANDRLFGGGYMVSTAEVFQRYAPIPTDVHAAHSIYFQVLGEHGWIGFVLFVAVGVSTWLVSRDLIRVGEQHLQLRWAGELGAMIQVSMAAYAVAGAFLSLAYYDLPYNVMAMAVLARKFAKDELALLKPSERSQASTPAPGPVVRSA